MELREISVEDVYPDEKNPRKDFGDIAALAESCMLNAINPGEPVNPIVVVADGGIYRIVDGERRYKAMCKNRLTRCHAVVCEDLDEANVMIAMVATDDKQQLSDIERSRGVQQAMLLGVDPIKVERMGRMVKGSAEKLRRARTVVDDAGDDMTLDRMLAIAEFEALGDAGAVERLASCREAEWREVERVERRRMKDDEMREALMRACEDAGIPISVERLYGKTGWKWCSDVRNPDDLAPAAAGIEGCVAYMLKNGAGSVIELCKPASGGDEEIDPAKVERMRRIDEVKGMIEPSGKNRLFWFNSRLGSLDSMPHVMEIVEESALFGYEGIREQVGDFEDKTGSQVDGAFCPLLAAYGYMVATYHAELQPLLSESLVDGRISSYNVSRVERFLEWLAAFEADGYEPTEADLELKRLCESALADDEEDEEEE